MRAIVVDRLRVGDAAAREGEAGLALEERQLLDQADAAGMIRAQAGYVARSDPRIADPSFRRPDLQQGFELEHAARSVADDALADRRRHFVGADRDRAGIAGDEDPHAAASSIRRRAEASSSRAKTRSPTIAAGPLAHRPRQ